MSRLARSHKSMKNAVATTKTRPALRTSLQRALRKPSQTRRKTLRPKRTAPKKRTKISPRPTVVRKRPAKKQRRRRKHPRRKRKRRPRVHGKALASPESVVLLQRRQRKPQRRRPKLERNDVLLGGLDSEFCAMRYLAPILIRSCCSPNLTLHLLGVAESCGGNDLWRLAFDGRQRHVYYYYEVG